MTDAGGFRRWLLIAIGGGVLTLVVALLPSPSGLWALFDAKPPIEVRKPPALALKELPPLSAYTEIGARPLFNDQRKPDPSSGRAVATTPAQGTDQGELSAYRVVGVVADSTTQRAIVERNGAPSVKLAPGDNLAGWRVERIDAAGVVASKDGRKVRIGIAKTRPQTGTQ